VTLITGIRLFLCYGESGRNVWMDEYKLLGSIAEGILDEGIIYDCPWDDFRFNYFRGKDSDIAARALGAWADSLGIKVEFDVRREGRLDVIYVFLAAG
jgi:hypothetical protein